MLEILDDPADARSYALCRPNLDAFNFYERWLIGRALKKNKRHRALIEIIDVALGTGKQEESRFYGSSMAMGQGTGKSPILTRDEMVRQTTASLNDLFQQEYAKEINVQVTKKLRK
jgi:hypothetical protein